MDPAWLEIARRYSAMSETERSAYWAGLDSTQRTTLEHALRQLPPMSASRGCGCGCGRFLGKGCLIFLITVIVLTLLNNLPWFVKPATDRFALWPDSTRDAFSFRAPIEPLVSKVEEAQAQDPEVAFLPVPVLKRWLAASDIDASSVSEVTFLNIVQDGGGWWYKDLQFDYDEITSAIAIVKLSTPKPDLIRRLPASAGIQTTIGGKPALPFDNPFPGLEQRHRNSGPAIEPWFLMALDERTVLIGGRTAVEYVLNTASGSRDGITSRRVVRPLLKAMEPYPLLRSYFVSPTKEKAIPVVYGIMYVLTAIPGLDLAYSYRARSFGFMSLPDGRCTRTVAYQYKARAAGRIHTMFLQAITLPAAKDYPVQGGNGLAVFTEPFACAEIFGGAMQK